MFNVADIVVVQSRVRCWLAKRKRAQMRHDHDQKAATVIQRIWRGNLGQDAALMRHIQIIICQVSQNKFSCVIELKGNTILIIHGLHCFDSEECGLLLHSPE